MYAIFWKPENEENALWALDPVHSLADALDKVASYKEEGDGMKYYIVHLEDDDLLPVSFTTVEVTKKETRAIVATEGT